MEVNFKASCQGKNYIFSFKFNCEYNDDLHYNDVIMGTMASQITSLTIVYSTVIQAQIKENIKAPRHWPLCGEFTGTGEFPAQRVSNAENVSIWWRHHVMQHSHIKNKQINDITRNWCYVIWFSPEMVILAMVAFPLQVIITITCSNFS